LPLLTYGAEFNPLLLLLKIRTAIDDIEAGFVNGSGQQKVA